MPTNEQIYAQLKEQGLVLSECTEINLPPIMAPKLTLLEQLNPYMMQENDYQTQPYELIIIPVLNNCFIVARSNTLMCFKYELMPITRKPNISRPFIINLKLIITNLHICDPKYLNDRGEIAFLVQNKNQITLYYLDLKNTQIIPANTMTFSNIVSLKFICQKQILILQSQGTINNSKYVLNHCCIQKGKVKLKKKFNAELEINDNQTIKQIDIAGNIDEQQQSTVCIFYFSVIKNNINSKVNKAKSGKDTELFNSIENSQVLKVREYLRDIEGNLTVEKNYTVITTKNQNFLPSKYQMKNYNSFYLFASKHQILIFKKKFQRYLFIDNVIEKSGSQALTYHQKGIVTSQHGNSMELNMIFFNDPKCYSKLFDNIEISNELSDGFMMLWPFKLEKQVNLMLVFKKDKKLVFSSLIKMNPIEKMIIVVQNSPKQKVSIIQQIALHLGISKKDFYLSQWIHSKREIPQIHQFLLHCDDISNIKRQLRSILRKRNVQVSEFIKILEKLSKIIKTQLNQKLSQYLLIQYLKNDFLLRKIKLKESNWKIDFKQLDRIYNSSLPDMFVQIVKSHLYPQKEMLDPLHAMVSAPVKQQMSLKHVFQVFRIPILYQYNRFLIRFVSQFSPQQIVNVFRHYSFLLPIYEFNPNLIMHKPQFQTEVQLQQMVQQKKLEKPNIQQLQFMNITSMEFSREMSHERLEKELLDYYPTSKIHQVLNFLVASDFGIKMKLHKHGLITCTMLEYKQQLQDISGIKLYLRLCQFVNQYNLDSEQQGDNLSKQIVEILRQQNKLQGKAYETVRLYTQIHRFMLQHNFFEKKSLSAEQLLQLTSQDLVALFFLQNKQRKEFIFRQFRQIFINLYNSPKEFNQVIQKFISSQNCSRIELQIFILEIKSQNGTTFQFDNQQLIEIIIDGYCKKLQLREENETQRFIDIMQDIELTKKLAMKVNKIYKIRQCLNVFITFNCQKQTYYTILKYEQNNEIFKILLERYFTGEIRENVIRIDDEDVPLEYCRNMLNVLLYLQDSVYYDVSERQLLLIYCQVLIEWKQYQVILSIIHQEQILQRLNINRTQFINDLVSGVIDKLYTDPQILFSQQTKQHLHEILNIYQSTSNLVIDRENAKLQLAAIFESWGINVHLKHIHLLVEQWINADKEILIKDLIKTYINQLTFQTFSKLYFFLKKASSDENDLKQNDQIQNKNQFANFALYYAEKLLEHQNYTEIASILAYVKGKNYVQVSYGLISETFLKLAYQKYPTFDMIQKAKEVIEYFSQNFQDNLKMKKVFQTGLQGARFESNKDREQKIIVSGSFCFKHEHVQVSVQMLWKICLSLYNNEKVSTSITTPKPIDSSIKYSNAQKKTHTKTVASLYNAYYFLLMIFRHPEHGFNKGKISYSLEMLTELMFRLESKIDQCTELWCINVYSLFKKYLKGLYLEGVMRIKQVNQEIFHAQFTSKADDSHLQVIKAALKQDRQKNIQLLKCISRVENFLAAYKAVKKMEKEYRLEKIVLEEQKEREEKQKQERLLTQMRSREEQESLIMEGLIDENITISLKKFNYLKNNMSMQSSFSGIIQSEKQIMNLIYVQQAEEKKRTLKKNKTMIVPSNPFHMLLPSYLSRTAKQPLIEKICDDIKHEQWQKLTAQYERQDLVTATERLFFSFEMSFKYMVRVLQELGIVDARKVDVCKLCILYLMENPSILLPSQQLKRLLPFTYLVQRADTNTQGFNQHMYTVMRQEFPSLIDNKTADFIREMAIALGSIFNNGSYIARFCIDVLLLLNKHNFQPQNIIKISTIMHLLKGYPQEVKMFAKNILEAFGQNQQLLMIIKQELLNILRDSGEDMAEIEKFIKEFDGKLLAQR